MSDANVFRVGVYVDGYNLYYGMRSHMGKSTPGWRWLDIRKMIEPYAYEFQENAQTRVVYCTARVNPASSQTAAQDQQFYLRALQISGSVDEIVYGHYVIRPKKEYLIERRVRHRIPELLEMTPERFAELIPDPQELPICPHNGLVRVDIRRIEEKGSDVNVATHLLQDMYEKRIGAAIVITNDSDLSEPIRIARKLIPVGVLNPHNNYISGSLKPRPEDNNVSGSWNRKLKVEDFIDNQMPPVVEGLLGDQNIQIRKPLDW